MHDHPDIQRYLADVLRRSCLPVRRRAEVTEELRGHLEHMIAARRQAGRTEQEAVESALIEFGPPQVIRKQLRRHQNLLDRRAALRDLRRRIWLPLGFAACAGIVPAVFAPETDSLLMRCIGGAALGAAMFVLVAVFMYAETRFGYQVRRRRPRGEYSFTRSCARWMGVIVLALAGSMIMALVSVAAVAPLAGKTWLDARPTPLFTYNFCVACWDLADWNLAMAAPAIVGFGLPLALYERSRCVDEPRGEAAD